MIIRYTISISTKVSKKQHNIISWHEIFQAWPNSWRQLLCITHNAVLCSVFNSLATVRDLCIT